MRPNAAEGVQEDGKMDDSGDRELVEGAKRSQNWGTDQYDAHQRNSITLTKHNVVRVRRICEGVVLVQKL